ncbi:type II secretion system F family protein [Paludisphaera mucosa]|uniref:Type II secretion system F family protein n=1 Tax=Paludisphaera mucosa TaxID=3030827 RepID=A0ABT6F923_9BACT|nr:type II secretion system F family protein [Paludisphaera mucosa]MDG3004022.1 type II secretion system F family protein [Paludisphaera mucosa]
MIESRENHGGGGGLTPGEANRLSEHVAGVAEAGLPLGPGLRALAEESPRGAFRDTLRGLADSIERGVPLEAAVDDEASRIPPHLRGLIRAGLRTGNLGDVLGRFSAVASVGADLKRSFWIGMAYPLLAISLAGVLFVLVDLLIVGKFEAIFLDFGVPLPTLTRFMLQVSHAVRLLWPAVLAAVLAIVAGWAFVGLILPRASRNSLLGRLPIFGPLWRFTSWAEFCHLLAMLLEADLPLPEALRLTGSGVENNDVDLACRAMARSVEQGASLSAAMQGGAVPAPTGPFDHLARPKPQWDDVSGAPADKDFGPAEAPPLGDLLEVEAGSRAIRRSMPEGLPRLLRWAEGRSAIAEVLHMAGETFQSRSRAEASFGGGVVAFLATVGVVAGVFIVVIGMFLPLITLISKLSG